MRRYIALICLCLLCLLHISCSRDIVIPDSGQAQVGEQTQVSETDTTEDTQEPSTEPDKTLTVLTGNVSDSLVALAEAIERDLGIHTEFETYSFNTPRNSILQVRLASRNMPDIFFYQIGSLMYVINPAENVVDLTDEAFAKVLAEPYIEAASIDGKLYSIPGTFSANIYVWLYNRQIYNDMGLEPPATWDDFMENCKKIESAGITPITAPYQDEWRSQLIFLNDAYNLMSVEPDFPAMLTANKARYSTTAPALRSFEKLAEAGRYYDDDYLTLSTTEALRRLLDGEAAHMLYSFRTLDDTMPTGEPITDYIGFFSQPGDDPDDAGITVWMPDSYYIYKNSPNVEIAKQWLAYYLSPERIDAGNSSSTKLVIDAKSTSDPSDSDIYLAQCIRDGKYVPAIEFKSPLKGSNCIQICMNVTSGLYDALSGAKAYDQDIERTAIQLGLPGW